MAKMGYLKWDGAKICLIAKHLQMGGSTTFAYEHQKRQIKSKKRSAKGNTQTKFGLGWNFQFQMKVPFSFRGIGSPPP